jgi:hypothetical protein
MLKFDEEKSENNRVWISKMVLAQHFSNVLRLLKGTAKSNIRGKEECNKYDMIADPCF